MNKKRSHQLISGALQELERELSKGTSQRLERYLRAMSRFHRYSARNLLLILAQQPNAQHIAGYHTWRKLGRYVKRGARGILILAPIVHHDRDDEPDAATAENEAVAETTSDNTPEVTGFRQAYVFDVSQTAGRPLPTLAPVSGDPKDWLNQLRASVVASGIRLGERTSLAGANGAAAGGQIFLRRGLPPAAAFATLVHEWAHELLHFDRDGSSRGHSHRETEAEAVAFVVCQAVGLDCRSAARDYIQLHGGSAHTLAESLERVRQAAHRILETLPGAPPFNGM